MGAGGGIGGSEGGGVRRLIVSSDSPCAVVSEVPSTAQAIEATLDYTHGDKTHAARALGIGRKTLYRKLDQYTGKDTNAASSEE